MPSFWGRGICRRPSLIYIYTIIYLEGREKDYSLSIQIILIEMDILFDLIQLVLLHKTCSSSTPLYAQIVSTVLLVQLRLDHRKRISEHKIWLALR